MIRYDTIYTEAFRAHYVAADPTAAANTPPYRGAVSNSNKTKKKRTAPRFAPSAEGSNACIVHNFDKGGCNNNRCRWPHECRKCGDCSHIAPNWKKQ